MDGEDGDGDGAADRRERRMKRSRGMQQHRSNLDPFHRFPLWCVRCIIVDVELSMGD